MEGTFPEPLGRKPNVSKMRSSPEKAMPACRKVKKVVTLYGLIRLRNWFKIVQRQISYQLAVFERIRPISTLLGKG